MEMAFSKRLALSFASLGVMMAALALVGIYSLTHVVQLKDRVLDENVKSVQMAQQLQTLTYQRSAAIRGYLMSGEESFLERLNTATLTSSSLEKDLADHAATAEDRALAARADNVDTEWEAILKQMSMMRTRNASLVEVNHFMLAVAQPKRMELEKIVDALAQAEMKEVERAKTEATRAATTYRAIVFGVTLLMLFFAATLPWWLNHLLAGRIAEAVNDIQSSSTELQTTATQQATGAREQSSAMSEITTTMTELLTTSRQIAQSAQRVSSFSSEVATAARTSEGNIKRARGSAGQVREQVDVIVNHMLDLGRRSQQIGGVSELMNELADQTNILAINANIEAVGAGEAGRRFGVVADEIRSLADRMSNAAREIRGMVDEVRGAVNTTVMATESGSKAVDAGTKDFDAVSESLEQITSLGQTASEAAREIELSTKQQSTAVEQVNVAVSAVAQVSREVEASTVQASQTASELARLSSRMAALVNHRSTPS